MKLTTFLLLITFIGAHALTKAQSINLNVKNVNIEKILGDITKQTGIQFVYEDGILKNSMRSVRVQNASLDKTLENIFSKTDLNYVIHNGIVVINKKAVTVASTQNLVFRGKVRDENGDPMPGVTITEVGTTNSTQSDVSGNFSLTVSRSNARISFSTVGYYTQQLNYSPNEMNISLEQESHDVDEVVITGYMTQEKRSVTGAMSSIKASQIENMPVPSLDRAMQGQVSGVNIMANNGVPGGPVRINIRGIGSITAGTQPLIIVDGVQLNMETTAGQTAGNPLSFLNPNDIESIDVLKDGAAASIYGAQAANGVILVTTKKGKGQDGKTVLNLNYYNGTTTPMPKVDMMNSQQLINARLESRQNRYPTRTEERNREDVLSSLGLPLDITDEEIAALPTYDWQEAAFTTGKTNNLELSVNGGSERTTFFVSGSYNKTDGNVIGIDFQRATGRINLTHKLTDRLSFELGANAGAITQNGTSGSTGSSGAFAAPQYAAPMILPWLPLYNEDGSINGPIEGFPGAMNRNPIHETLLNTRQSRTKSLLSNFRATYKITDDLSFSSFYGIDYRIIDDEVYVDPRTRSGAADQGSLHIGNRKNSNFLTNQTLTYRKSINNQHNISGVGGMEYRYDNRELHSINATGFTTHQFRSLQSAAVITSGTGNWTGFKRVGIFGQANYDYEKRYMVSAVLRYDGSSRFGDNNKFGWFPALSAGWDIAAESFTSNLHWLNQLKLRGGYGETGNDAIGNFDSRALFASSSSTNYNQLPGLRPNQIANTFLRWERNVTTNIGIDYSIFNNRLSGSAELFRRRSKDLLLDRPLPYLSGFSNVTSNIGELKNEGVEFELRSVNVRTNDFTWTTNFNITFLKNRVVRLDDGQDVLPGDQSVRVGYALGTNFFREYAGVNSATGRPMWYDINGEITYNPVDDDRKIFGNQLSDYFGGFTNEFTYKGISLNVFFHYDYGRELSNSGMNSFWYRNGQDARNGLAQIYENRWTTPGQVTNIPRPYDGGSEVNSITHVTGSSRFLEDASFIRLKQLSLTYNLPQRVTSKLRTNSIRVYAQGHNLLTWTKWTGYDPELIIGEGNFTSTQGAIPQTRAYTFGIQVGF